MAIPNIDPSAFVHPSAVVIGSVTIEARASVWATAVIRADTDHISIGEASNVQDGCVLHCDPGIPCTVGRRVTIGHRAIVHGATVEDDCLIGMGAILLNGVVVGRNSIIAAGAVCAEGMVIPPNSVVRGVPGRVVRETDHALLERIRHGSEAYVALAVRYRAGEFALVAEPS